MYKNYTYFEKSHPNTIVFEKEGCFYSVRNESAIVLSNVFNLNLTIRKKDDYKTGVPEYSLDKYLNDIEMYHINYIVVNGGKIYDKENYIDNNFSKYLKHPSELNYTKNLNEKSINEGDEITIKLVETEEVFTLEVVPSYFKYDYTGMGGSYYGSGTRIVDDSVANISEGTINIDAPLIKRLNGVNEKEYFEVEVDDTSTKYQLVAVKKKNKQESKPKSKENPHTEKISTFKQSYNENFKTKRKKAEQIGDKIYINDKNIRLFIPIEISCDFIKVENYRIKDFLDKYRDRVILFVNGSINYEVELGQVKYVLQYRDNKSYFEGSMTAKSLNQVILWGVLHGVKRVKGNMNVVIVLPRVLGFKKALNGKGSNADLIMNIYETLHKKGCNITIIHWHKGSNKLHKYIISKGL